MEATQYYDFQHARLIKKENVERERVISEESVRTAGMLAAWSECIQNAASTPDNKERSNSSRFYDPVGIVLPSLSAVERDDIMASLLKELTAAELSLTHLCSTEASARAQLVDWEESAFGCFTREVKLSLSSKDITRLADQEAVWRCTVERAERHELQQFFLLRSRTQMFLLQHPSFPGSCDFSGRTIRREESEMRWSLAVQFCALHIMWNEEWERLTMLLAQQAQRKYLRSLFELHTRETAEWGAILSLGRPPIVELLEILDEQRAAWRRDTTRLDNLKSVRREIIVKMHDRITLKEDYILEEKMRLVESILATQDALLSEVAEHDNDASVFERLSTQYRSDQSWITDPETPFGALSEYHKRMTQRRPKDDSTIPKHMSQEALKWVAGAPWESPNRKRAELALSQSSTPWKQYAQDHYRMSSVMSDNPTILSIMNIRKQQPKEHIPGTTGQSGYLGSNDVASPLDALYNKIVRNGAASHEFL